MYTHSLSSLHLSAAAWFPSAQLPRVSVSSSSRFEVAVFPNTGVLQQKGWAAESPFRSIHYHKKEKKTPHERLVTRRPHLFRSFIQTAVIDHSRMHWDFAQVVYMISFQRWAVDHGGEQSPELNKVLFESTIPTGTKPPPSGYLLGNWSLPFFCLNERAW